MRIDSRLARKTSEKRFIVHLSLFVMIPSISVHKFYVVKSEFETIRQFEVTSKPCASCTLMKLCTP